MAGASIVAGVGSAIGGYMSYKGAKEASKSSEAMMQQMNYYNQLGAGAIGKYESMIPYSAQFLPDISNALGQSGRLLGISEDVLGRTQGYMDSAEALFGEGAGILRGSLGYLGQAAGDYARARESAAKISPMLEEARKWSQEAVQNAKDFNDLMYQYGQEFKGWTQGLMDDWEDMFGDMQQNLVDYYNNLDPVKYATEWKSTIEQSLNKEMKQLNETLAQTGLYTTGMKMQLEKERQFKQAEMNAMADLESEERVMREVGDFYGKFGEPRLQHIENLYGQALINQAEMARLGNQAQQAALGQAGQTSLGAAQGYGMQGGLYTDIGRGMGSLASTQANIGQGLAGIGNYYNALAGTNMALGGAYGNLAGNWMNLGIGGYGGLMDAYQSIGDRYLQSANAYGNLASNYGSGAKTYAGSAAGYGQAAGKLFGNALSQFGSALGGTGGAFGGGIDYSTFSDSRLKTNIRKIGEQGPYNIYQWDWTKEGQELAGDAPTTGVIAQEVMATNPDAVFMDDSGYYKVDYRRL